MSSKGSTSKKAKYKERIYTYDRDIVCLPANYSQGKSSISIPRNREKLAKKGLIGKIRISSEMSQEEIFQEIRSVFRVPMNGNSSFQFQVLQQTGGRSKSLMVPAVSDSFKWTASAIAPKNAKVPLYVIAKEPLFADEVSTVSQSCMHTSTTCAVQYLEFGRLQMTLMETMALPLIWKTVAILLTLPKTHPR